MMLIVRYILFLDFYVAKTLFQRVAKRASEKVFMTMLVVGVPWAYLHPLITRAKIAGDSIRGDIV